MKVLLIEDDNRIAGFLKKGLEAEQCVLDVAPDGQMGINMAEASSYDAIILDMVLPVKGGKEVYLHLRRSRIKTPILMLTVLDKSELAHQFFQEGDDYLTKPFSFDVLLARLNALIGRSERPA